MASNKFQIAPDESDRARLTLADGTVYEGYSFGAKQPAETRRNLHLSRLISPGLHCSHALICPCGDQRWRHRPMRPLQLRRRRAV